MTPKQEAALRLALDCVSTLANARDWVGCTPNERWDEDEMYAELCNATICLKKSLSIIQEALAEQPAQQQEPVEWGVEWGKAGDQSCVSIIKRLPGGGIEVLATEYGPPASKPWVGLTDGEFTKIKASLSRHEGWDGDAWDFALKEAIEAKLREKNNG